MKGFDMSVLLSEFFKLLKVKVIWIVYIVGMIFVFSMAFNAKDEASIFTNQNNIKLQFVKHYGGGAYEKELIDRYANYYKEYKNNCLIDDDICLRNFINDNEELKLYKFKDTREFVYFLASFNLKKQDLEYYQNIEVGQSKIDELKEDDGFINNYFKKLYFEQRMDDYKEEANRSKVSIHSLYRNSINFNMDNYPIYLYYLSLIASIMLILSISSTFLNDRTSSTDTLILTSKIGRKIVKYKLIACVLTAILYSTILYIPFLLTLIFKNKVYYFLNIKLKSDLIYLAFWADLTLWQFFLIIIFLLIFTQVLIAIITAVISVHSNRLINTIVYNFLILITLLISSDYLRLNLMYNKTGVLFKQVIYIVFLHSPYVFIKKNINMLQYTPHFFDNYFNNYTYLFFPIVYVSINILMIGFLIYKTIRYYNKMNI